MSGLIKLLICVVLGLCISAESSASDCGSGTLRRSRKQSLHQAGRSIINAIEEQNQEQLMKYVSSWGLGFGVDRKPIPKEEIEKQLRLKEGVYCLLFSARCLATSELAKDLKSDDVLSKWTISYSEWLKINKPYSTEEELLDDDGTGGCGGIFTVQGHTKLKNAPTTIELELFLRNGNWVLTNTPNHLGN